MSIRRILLGAMLSLSILAIPVVAQAQGTTTITGSVTFSGSVPAASDILLVQLRDASGLRLVETQPAAGGKSPPYNYTLSIDSSRLRSGNSYLIVAQLGRSNRDRLYQGSTSIRISGTNLAAPLITMSRLGGRINETSSGALRLLAGLVLAALAGILWTWRWRRSRVLVRKPA